MAGGPMTREFPPPDARLEGKVKIFQFSAPRDVLGVACSDEVLLGRMVKDGAVLRVAKGVYATPDYVPPPDDNPSAKGAKDRPRRSVSLSAAATDGRQMPRGSQHIDVEQESPSICVSVASVRQSANAIGADDACGPSVQTMQTQTDRTDRQIDAQGADSSVEVRADGARKGWQPRAC